MATPEVAITELSDTQQEKKKNKNVTKIWESWLPKIELTPERSWKEKELLESEIVLAS